MLSNLTLKKSKQTEKLKVITAFQCGTLWFIIAKNQVNFGSNMTFLKNLWFKFRLLKDNSMLMINSMDFASDLQKNREM